jgi:hypothetical protein
MERSEEWFPHTGGLRTVFRPIKSEVGSVFVAPRVSRNTPYSTVQTAAARAKALTTH